MNSSKMRFKGSAQAAHSAGVEGPDDAAAAAAEVVPGPGVTPADPVDATVLLSAQKKMWRRVTEELESSGVVTPCRS